MVKFYDTNALLLKMESLFEEHFAISSVSLSELEKIKTSAGKDQNIKYSARRLLHLLDIHKGSYDVHIFNNNMLTPIANKALPFNDDLRILATAIDYDNTCHPDDTVFVTNDLSLKNIANLFFGEDSIESVSEDLDPYTGYADVTLNDKQMEDFYSNLNNNMFNLYTNQYLIVRDKDGQIVDKLCWTGEGYRPIGYYNFNSEQFGDIKPMRGDVYQAFVADSLVKNKITMIKGPAGSGKTMLSLGYLFHLLDRNKINKIVIFCNTIATQNSAKLGYLPGTRDEKLLDSQIGLMLISKIGDRLGVERLIDEGKLVLLPFSDIRGYETEAKSGIYFSEAQNLDIVLIKLGLQRIDNDSICIIDGDSKAQVDDIAFSGHNNGMRRVSKVYRGEKIYGEVELKNIYRSEIARIAEGL